jgi:hypothetical protein
MSQLSGYNGPLLIYSGFKPYASIGTNLLFFEKGTPTKDIWFYEHRVPEGQKAYSMTKPIRFEHLQRCIDWWGGAKRKGREEMLQAWKVTTEDVKAHGYNPRHQEPAHRGGRPRRSGGIARKPECRRGRDHVPARRLWRDECRTLARSVRAHCRRARCDHARAHGKIVSRTADPDSPFASTGDDGCPPPNR